MVCPLHVLKGFGGFSKAQVRRNKGKCIFDHTCHVHKADIARQKVIQRHLFGRVEHGPCHATRGHHLTAQPQGGIARHVGRTESELRQGCEIEAFNW